MMSNHPSSFRDPSGFMFSVEGTFYRCVNKRYAVEYDKLMSSGLYKELVNRNLIISHVEVSMEDVYSEQYKILKPEQLEFITYPYEWSFSQLKDAALTTLTIQKIAMEYGMSLKDASAFNIQFHKGKPVFIDTLSFEVLKQEPWVAYKQFCQHFFGPLLLMRHIDPTINKITSNYIDGVPLSIISKMLPPSTKFSMGILMHIHLHAKSQTKYASAQGDDIQGIKEKTSKKMDTNQLRGLIESLISAISEVTLNKVTTEWGDYYSFHNYSKDGFEHKKQIISEYMIQLQPQKVLDIGGNIGEFSKAVVDIASLVINTDIDPLAVEKNYQYIKKSKLEKMITLVNDITNPPPGIGVMNRERDSFIDRVKGVDVVMALAIIHHLSISNNIPLEDTAKMFSALSGTLVIEFVPKTDGKVMHLLETREDIFPLYTVQGFEKAYTKYFTIEQKTPVFESERIMYLMKRL